MLSAVVKVQFCVRRSVTAIQRAALTARSNRSAAREFGLPPCPLKIVRGAHTTSIDDTKYNQIPGLIYYEGFSVPADPKAKQAVEVCFAAKTVRDDLAHMRAPRPEAIVKLTSLMEKLLAP